MPCDVQVMDAVPQVMAATAVHTNLSRIGDDIRPSGWPGQTVMAWALPGNRRERPD